MKKTTFYYIRTFLSLGLFLFLFTSVRAQIDVIHQHKKDTVLESHALLNKISHHSNLKIENHSKAKQHQYNNHQINSSLLELKDFRITAHNEHFTIKWETGLKNTTHGFTIEHSIDNKNWKSLTFVEATNASQHGIHHHNIKADTLESGFHHFRLVQMDLNDHPHHSHSIGLGLDHQETQHLAFILPNHFHKTFHLILALKHSQDINIHLEDIHGHSIKTLVDGTLAGHMTHAMSIHMESMSTKSHSLHVNGKEYHLHHNFAHTAK